MTLPMTKRLLEAMHRISWSPFCPKRSMGCCSTGFDGTRVVPTRRPPPGQIDQEQIFTGAKNPACLCHRLPPVNDKISSPHNRGAAFPTLRVVLINHCRTAKALVSILERKCRKRRRSRSSRQGARALAIDGSPSSDVG